MDRLIVAFAAIGCLICVLIPLGGVFVVLLYLDLGERRVPPARVERRIEPALVKFRVSPLRPAHIDVALELDVDPADAARTDRLLRELIATRGLEDW
jgi:hypothetical protein